MTTALEGLRVLDLSNGFAGAIASMVLCDNGAEVIKVEPPGGDALRSAPAFYQWYRGKKSVVLDLKDPVDAERARRLSEEVDVLVQTWRPGVAERLGLGYETLAAANPRLIYCAISGFGTKGKYARVKGYEHVVEAVAGRLASESRAGLTGRQGALFMASPLASFGASQAALHGILAALHVRERCGRGQRVDTSLVQGLSTYDVWGGIIQWVADQNPDDFVVVPAVTDEGVPLTPYHFYLLVTPTKDGRWLQFTNVMPHMWKAFISAIGLEEIYEDPDLRSAPRFERQKDSDRFWNILIERLREKTYDEWMEIFLPDQNIGVELIRTTQQAMDHPQMQINGHVVKLHDPQVGPTEQIGPLVTLWETPADVSQPAPTLGQHTTEVLASLGGGSSVTRPTAPPPQRALEDVTIVELGTFYAAPFGPALVADLGARVIKVEPLDGDPIRWAMPIPETGGAKCIQGKESIALDFGSEEGRQIVYELVRRADMVMCSYRAGVAARQGVDYEKLREINPNILYHHGVAYGLEGDYPRRPVFGPSAGAVAGEGLFQVGEGNWPEPDEPLSLERIKDAALRFRLANPGLNDATAADCVATGMLLSLLARDRTGKAQQSMTAMMFSNIWAFSDDFIRYAGKLPRQLPDGELYGFGPLYRLYESKSGWVFLASAREDEWASLAEALRVVTSGSVDLAGDDRFRSAGARVQHADALTDVLTALFRERTAVEWEDALLPHDVACVQVNEQPFTRFLLSDPDVVENGFVAEVDHYSFGRHPRHAVVSSLSLTPGRAEAAPRAGEQTRSILAELGYSDEQVEDLRVREVVRVGEDAKIGVSLG